MEGIDYEILKYLVLFRKSSNEIWDEISYGTEEEAVSNYRLAKERHPDWEFKFLKVSAGII